MKNNLSEEKEHRFAYKINKAILREVKHNTICLGLIQLLSCLCVYFFEKNLANSFFMSTDFAANIFSWTMSILGGVSLTAVACALFGPSVFTVMFAEDEDFFDDDTEFIKALRDDNERLCSIEVIANVVATRDAVKLQVKIFPYTEAFFGIFCFQFLIQSDWKFVLIGIMSTAILVITHIVQKKTENMSDKMAELIYTL